MPGFFGPDQDRADQGTIFSTPGAVGLYQAGPMPIKWPDKLNPRTDFDQTEIQRLAWQNGIPAIWHGRSPCCCGGKGRNAPNTECPVCGGLGWEYHFRQEVLLVAPNVDQRKRFLGEIPNPMATGSGVFSIRGEHVPAVGDRFVMQYGWCSLSIKALRAAPLFDPAVPLVRAVERLRYPVVLQTITCQDEDGNQYPQAVGVLHCRGQGPDGLPTPVLIEGTDFDVTEEGWLDWSRGDALPDPVTPRPGAFFSLYYRTVPVFCCTGHPAAMRTVMSEQKAAEPFPDVLPAGFEAKLEWLVEQR